MSFWLPAASSPPKPSRKSSCLFTMRPRQAGKKPAPPGIADSAGVCIRQPPRCRTRARQGVRGFIHDHSKTELRSGTVVRSGGEALLPKTHGSYWATAVAIGMVPCPGVVIVALFSVSLGLLDLGVILGLAISLGMVRLFLPQVGTMLIAGI